jgi:hypothetical protein
MARSLAQGNEWVNDPGEKDQGREAKRMDYGQRIELNKMADSCWLSLFDAVRRAKCRSENDRALRRERAALRTVGRNFGIVNQARVSTR